MFRREILPRLATVKLMDIAEAVGFQDLLHADPLLLLPAMAERLQGFADSPGETASPRVLIWALARGSPLEKEGQEAVFAAM